MNTSSKTTVITRMIQEEQKQLVLTFTPEEIETLLVLGNTSHYERVKFLESFKRVNEQQANECSNLLSEIYFAAAKFKRQNPL
jgi:hypothetical protein